MLTPKIRKTNLVKDNTGFKVGGYARSRAFGTRVYKVIAQRFEPHTRITYGPINGIFGSRREEVNGWIVTLAKVGETNKGRFKFCNGRPFEVKQHDTGHWYYPAKGI